MEEHYYSALGMNHITLKILISRQLKNHALDAACCWAYSICIWGARAAHSEPMCCGKQGNSQIRMAKQKGQEHVQNLSQSTPSRVALLLYGLVI